MVPHFPRGPRALLHALLLLVLLPNVAPVRAEEPEQLAVTRDGDRLSVDASASLLRILERIGEVAGVPILLETGLETRFALEPRTVAFAGLTLEEALDRLLPSRNVMLVHSTRGLDEVRVYADGKRRPGRADVRGEGAAETGGAEASLDAAAEAARLRKEALNNPDPLRRMEALEELAASGDEKVMLQTAAEILERERNSRVLESALDNIDRDSLPVDSLLNFAASDREPSLRIRALELLSQRDPPDPRMRALLRRLARTEKDEELRETAGSLLRDLEAE